MQFEGERLRLILWASDAAVVYVHDSDGRGIGPVPLAVALKLAACRAVRRSGKQTTNSLSTAPHSSLSAK
jgi:hypothetical protein